MGDLCLPIGSWPIWEPAPVKLPSSPPMVSTALYGSFLPVLVPPWSLRAHGGPIVYVSFHVDKAPKCYLSRVSSIRHLEFSI